MIILTISQPSSNMGHVGSKTRSVGQIIEKPCEHDTVHIMHPISMKICQNVCLDETSVKLNMGHVTSNTRSVGQIIEKPCEPDASHIMHPIIMKICQNVCLDQTLVNFEYGSCCVKNKVSRSNLRKTL